MGLDDSYINEGSNKNDGIIIIPYLQLTLWSFISLFLGHIPSLALAHYGLVCVLKKSKNKVIDGLKIIILISLPYFQFMSLVNVVEIFLKLINVKSNSIIEKFCHGCYPWFLPKKEDYKRNDSKMFLDIMRMIFGTCLNLCLQSVLLAYTETDEIKPTQTFKCNLRT